VIEAGSMRSRRVVKESSAGGDFGCDADDAVAALELVAAVDR
jgi:hypothetical protein